jgi:hypothetical protein
MLPKSNFEKFIIPIGRTPSETYPKNHQTNTPAKDTDFDLKNRARVSFSRENLSGMNKRLR